MNIRKDIDTQSDVISIFQRVMNQAFYPYRNRILITTDSKGNANPIPIGSSDHLVYYIADSVSKNRTRLGVSKEITENSVYYAIQELLIKADKVRSWYEKSSEEILGHNNKQDITTKNRTHNVSEDVSQQRIQSNT